METLGSIIFSSIGLILIVFALQDIWKNNQIKKRGILTSAEVISFSIEDGVEADARVTPKIKIPILSFTHKKENGRPEIYRVKGKSNFKAKIGEKTPIYYNPKNPEKEYYLPEKDFLNKYVFVGMGVFFFFLGVLMS